MILSVITTIVAHNRRRSGRLSHITAMLSSWGPLQRRSKNDSTVLTST
jgi:hypothetical protein